MKKTIGYVLVAWALLSGCQPGKTAQPELRVGVASAHINPEVGAYIAGDRQDRKFTGVRDSLFAKAVVFSDGEEKIALVTLDCIGLMFPEVQRIRQRAAELCPIDASRIVVSSTHTHSGPDVVGLWGSDYAHSGVDSVYMEFLVQTAARQVKNALANLQPAKVITAETQFGEPWVQNICDEEIDRTVAIMQLQQPDGAPIATLTNFACHPTYLDAKFSEVSADYVQGYYRTVKASGGGEAFFLQGAIGGWVQPVDGEASFEKAYQRGNELAQAVRQALGSGKELSNTRLAYGSLPLQFPVENEGWKQLAAIGTIKRSIADSVETEVSWFAVGDAQFATHPGETAPYYGLETKRLMGGGPKFILGLGNDAIGYILKPSFFEDPSIPHAEYLTSMSVGKPAGPLMMEGLSQLISENKLQKTTLSTEQ